MKTEQENGGFSASDLDLLHFTAMKEANGGDPASFDMLAYSVLAAAFAAIASGGGYNAPTGTAYTLALSDASKLVDMNNAAANTVTVPPNSDVAFPIHTRIDIGQYGDGTTTIVAGAGVTLRAKDAELVLNGKYAGATLQKIATDEWRVFGDLTA